MRTALTDAFFEALGRGRSYWQSDLDQFSVELAALHRAIEKQRALCQSQPKTFSQADRDLNRDDNARRLCTLATQWTAFEKGYNGYVAAMSKLLSLPRAQFDPFSVKIDEVIPKYAMGQGNTSDDLQNYVIGMAFGGC